MVAELYDALPAAGAPDDKARKAAEAMAVFDAYEQRVVHIEANTSDLQRDVGELKHDVAVLKEDVSSLKRDVVVLKEDVSALKRDVFLLKWMMGFVLAFQVAIFIKLFLH